MKVLSVVGARPNFMKLAPIAQALRTANHEHVILHTGQHYDPEMSSAFFDELAISPPDRNLEVGSGTHASQTAGMLVGIEEVIEEGHFDWVLAYGDTNTTVATVLAAAKIHVPTGHVEAGLRSFNRRLAEEVNRVVADHVSDLLFAPTAAAVANLAAEGLVDDVLLVGDVMVDLLLNVRDRLVAGEQPAEAPAGPYVAATLHRPINTDVPGRLAAIMDALNQLDVPVVLPAHPRLRRQLETYGLATDSNLHVISPVSYRQMISLVVGSEGVITDSGGLQKEAFVLGRPVTTLRSETPWPETVANDRNVLMGGDLSRLGDVATRKITADAANDAHLYGGGDAAGKIVRALEEHRR